MTNISGYISQIFLFDSLSQDNLDYIADFCTMKSAKKSDHLFLEGDIASAFYYIVNGRFKIYKVSAGGLEHILEILEDGSLIAEAAIFDRETYPAYCQALEESVLIKIPKDKFIEMIIRQPDLSLKILNAYSKRLRYFVSQIVKLSMQDVKSRFARYLLEKSEKTDNKFICNLNISKKELASLLGTIPETLSRVLRLLKEEGIIEENGNRIVILDRKRLKEME